MNYRAVGLTDMPELRRLVTLFPKRWRLFDLRSGHMGFVVYEMTEKQFLFRVFLFPLPILIQPTAPHLFILSSTLLSLHTDSVVEWSASKELNSSVSQKFVL
jgi:hypothetical protein